MRRRAIPPTTTADVWTSEPRRPRRHSRYALFAALGIVAAAGAVAIAVALGGGGEAAPAGTTQAGVTPIEPVALSLSQLEARVAAFDQPVYWVGPVPGDTYELTRTVSNDVYVRYLEPGAKAGTHEGEFLLVATYPVKGALAALKASHTGPPLEVAGAKGAIAAVERKKPTNVHVAFPHVDYQVEVYDPVAKLARRLATSSDLKPVP